MIGRTLFYGQTDGFLYRRSFDGVSFGEPVQVNPYLDPLWSTVETGSGTAGQTYAGVAAHLVRPAELDHRHVLRRRAHLLHPQRPDLALLALVLPRQRRHRRRREHRDRRQHHVEPAPRACSSTAPRCTSSARPTGSCSGSASPAAPRPARRPSPTRRRDWRGRAVFLASVLPNVAPSAAFTSDCTGISCTFDGGGVDRQRRDRPVLRVDRSATATRPAVRPRRRTSRRPATTT